MAKHVCTGDCWAYMIRYGQPEGCDPFTARDAADRDIEAEGAYLPYGR